MNRDSKRALQEALFNYCEARPNFMESAMGFDEIFSEDTDLALALRDEARSPEGAKSDPLGRMANAGVASAF